MILLEVGMWFWIACIIELIMLTIFIETEKPGWATIFLIAFGIVLWRPLKLPVWEWVYNNPVTVIKYCILYVGCGVVWTFIKYYFHLRSLREKINLKKLEWEKEKDNYTDFKDFLNHNNYSYDRVDTSFEKTTKHIITWGSYWPISALWTLLNDPIKRFFKFLFMDVLKGIFQKMYQKMVGNLFEEISLSKKYGKRN